MARGKGWTTPETLYMLGLVEQVLPFRSNQWNAVQLEYNTNLPDGFTARDADSIKWKFNALKNTRKPTGDPACPADVAQAKRVYRLIEARCSVLVLDDAVTPVQTPSSPAGGVPPRLPGPSRTTDANSAADAQSVRVVESTATTTTGSTDASCAGISRTGRTAAELEQLSNAINSGTTELLSESARKRRRVDRLLDSLEGEDNSDWCTALLAMEERAAARELAYRRERDEQRRQDEERREEREALREEREQQRQERFLALVAEIVKKGD